MGEPDRPDANSRFFFRNEAYRVGDVSPDIHAKNIPTDFVRHSARNYADCLRIGARYVDGGQN